MQGLLQYYIGVAQKQYSCHIREKIDALRMEPATDTLGKINSFKIKLMEYALTPEDEFLRLHETQK